MYLLHKHMQQLGMKTSQKSNNSIIIIMINKLTSMSVWLQYLWTKYMMRRASLHSMKVPLLFTGTTL